MKSFEQSNGLDTALYKTFFFKLYDTCVKIGELGVRIIRFSNRAWLMIIYYILLCEVITDV